MPDLSFPLVPTLISLFALAISSLSLYLQRRDKRPRLTVALQQGHIKFHVPDKQTGGIERPLPGFRIIARNPTERTIKVESIVFVDREKRRYALPSDWPRITEVPPHERITIDMSIPKLNDWVTAVGVPRPEKGYFLLTDHLANEYKTPTLGKGIVLSPDELVKIKGVNFFPRN